MDNFDRLLSRSQEFSALLAAVIESAPAFASGERPDAAGAAAELSFEHAHALRILFGAWTPNSAAAMLRLQYESLLRAAWLLYAASDDRIGKVAAPLNQKAAAAAKNLPGADEMLKTLERLLQTQPELKGLILPLREIREFSWAAMNAFVHSGLHPLARVKEGFPIQLAVNLVKLSNGMLHMAARLLARLTPSIELVKKVEQSYLRFEDCLPIITPPPKATNTLFGAPGSRSAAG